MVNVQRLFWIFVLFLGLWPQWVDAAQVRAVADRDRITVEESLRLELRVSGSPDGDPDLSPLESDWEVLGRSQSSQVQIINGDFSRSLVYSLTLLPRREGELTIPALCFGADCSAPLSIQVSAADQGTVGEAAGELLLETEATPYKLFVQQQLLFKVRLLHRVDLLQGSLTEPKLSGVDAVVQKLGDDRRFETRRGGRLYQVIERTYAIFPQASGTLEIAPLRFDGEVGRGGARFDPFNRLGERVRKQTQSLPIEVLPPPADRGSRNWLPAQAVTLEDDWQGQTLQLTVGEPATRTLRLRAEGLQAAQLLELGSAIPAQFKSYPDQPSRNDESGAAGITGALQQKIALVPTVAGRYQLPAIDLDWWDVQAKAWRQAHLDPVEIEVLPAASAAAAPSAPPVAAPPPAPSAPASSPPAVAAPVAAPPQLPGSVMSGFWPWLSLALGLGWLATLVLWGWQRRRRSRRVADAAGDPAQQREKDARQAVLRAARGNDASAARQALTVWCRTLWPGSPAALERLGQLTPEWQQEIDRLNRALYAAGGEPWDGRSLSEAIRCFDQRRQPAAGDALPALYPELTAPAGRTAVKGRK